MRCSWDVNALETKQRTVSGNILFKYLGSPVAANGGCESDMAHQINDKLIARNCSEQYWIGDKCKQVSIHIGIIVPTL